MQISDKNLQDIIKRRSIAFASFQNMLPILIWASESVLPESNALNILYHYRGDESYKDYYTSNAFVIIESEKRANNLVALLAPLNKRWGSAFSYDKQGKKQRSEIVSRIISNAIDTSNLYDHIHSAMVDFNIGRMALSISISPEPDDDTIRFEGIPGMIIFSEVGPKEKVAHFWTRIMSEAQFIMDFGREPQSARLGAVYVDCCHYYIEGKSGQGFYRYLEIESDTQNVLTKSDNSTSRLIVVDDTVFPGESRGRGIILTLKPDILTYMEIDKGLKAKERYSAEPALIASSNMPENFQLKAGTVLHGALSENGEPLIQAIDWAIQENLVIPRQQEREARIQRAFATAPYGQPEQTGNVTATEIGARRAEAERQTVSDISRLGRNFNLEIMSSVYNLLLEKGAITEAMVGSNAYSFQFDSVETNVQSRVDINSVKELFINLQQMYGPQIASKVLPQTNIAPFLAERLNVDEDLLDLSSVNAGQEVAPDQIKPQEPIAPQQVQTQGI